MIARIGPTPLLSLGAIGQHKNVFLKDESVHPSGTFKDRLAALAIAKGGEDILFGSISYGNTALSFARACAGAPWARFVAFVPPDFASWTFGPSTSDRFATGADFVGQLHSYGCPVLEVDLSSRRLGDDDLARLAQDAGLLGNSTFVNVTEGLDVPAYQAIAWEALQQLGGAPDICVVQFGAGILANEVRDVFGGIPDQTVVVPISTPDPRSLACMLYGPIWTDISSLSATGAAMSRHESPDKTGRIRQPYEVFRVSEEQILDGLRIARAHGISAEPSGAAGLGFLDALPSIVPTYDNEHDRILIINTGNGIDRLAHRDGPDS